jgi:hypothetical protein
MYSKPSKIKGFNNFFATKDKNLEKTFAKKQIKIAIFK